MEGIILEVNRYEVSKVQFLSSWRWSKMLILFGKLAPKMEGWIWEAPFAHYDSESEDFMQSL